MVLFNLAAPVRFERTQCLSQSQVPYRLAMGQFQYHYNIFIRKIHLLLKIFKSIINGK